MFYKDIWSLIFEKLEFDLDFKSLNSLSLTCKKLYQLDLERQINLLKDLEKDDFLIHLRKKENFLSDGYKKNRNRNRNFLKLIKYRNIGILDIDTYKKSENINRSFFSIFPDLCNYLERLKINKYEDFLNGNKKDIELISSYTKCTELVSSFLLFKNNN